ncbi:DUF6086 family protein [Nonomuraea gerenzanensis]|uniref:Uncharacterized protein n=1 Tax=Nonomuraea gerenzanensis TaxID=93944 RepID=A0A1M4EQM9_9ACTN|nr:DUF6086 family protein [Nonomuraea gerenzanensis]UBU12594.1 DUF6086 family protein [Nonomuraea gerenzanensis]SBP01149.1 SCH10.09, hypothetical protein, len: 169 aa; unknown function, probable CDS suggested by positional base preference, GC frame analysis and amino acid composition [Nonomuraea gerenzanensis]
MSQYYQVGEQVLWNPSNGVSALFLRSAQALAPEAGLPTGLGPMRSDECQIDLETFTAFVGALVDRYERTNHPILHALMEGFIATALVLVQRAGAELGRSAPGDGRRDVQVGGPSTGLPDGRSDGRSDGRWAELCARYARAMPR